VSAEQGSSASLLVAGCAEQQTHELRLLGDAVPQAGAAFVVNCDSGTIPPLAAPVALGEPCVNPDENHPDFPGYSASEVNIDDNSPVCASRVCVQNHFQGRASCPYGQTAGDAGCLVAGSNVPVTAAVKPQLEQRQAATASTCSCQCAGYGPGPYCTCPVDMECDHLVDKLSVAPTPGTPDLSGSYCIPNGSLYDKAETAVCAAPGCGDAHPY
jgi:hypothetical protein